MDDSHAEKAAVHDSLENFLDGLDELDCEPDRWDEACLARALTAMAVGNYRLAALEVTKAATPPNKRSPEGMAHLDSTSQKFTKHRLRQILQAMRTLASDQAAKARARQR